MTKRTHLHPDSPLLFSDHRKPMTRREFISTGLAKGGQAVAGLSLMSMFANPNQANAALSSDLEALRDSCGISVQGAGKIPFISFDLAGGANIAGSNVLVGGAGGQQDFLSTAGYNKLGLPGDMAPSIANPDVGMSDFINTDLGLAFHSDSAFLRGILEKVSADTASRINGAVIPCRSDNDTGNNPHNPMYAIAAAGANGSLMPLIGSRSTDSGGNSMAAANFVDLSMRPTKIDRPSDVTGLVDVGDLFNLLSQRDAVTVMESIQRISAQKMASVNTQVTRDDVIKDLVNCGYVKSADLADRFGDPSTLNPVLDPDIVGPSGIFTINEFDSESEFQKTASIMKLVVNGFSGAGTVTMGGFDYHTGERGTGELRDLRAGRCMGACLEYAARRNQPLMMYVFSDGSVASNGRIDDSMEGRGKGEWTGDNSSTGASFFLVYNPAGKPQLMGSSADQMAQNQQIGFMRSDASVDTASAPSANNVNLLVDTVLLNYMALHGEQGQFNMVAPRQGLGNSAMLDSLTAFQPIV
ncbi:MULTISPECIES: general secretion pathway protein GspF [Shewanella]|uniref:General secretion pathway protein GspF n=1 Tax=Shewanella electrodiphila TaxID=934143 RepID=A0ABT0KJM7_9GAMM|nr:MULTISPECIES: general secretion pathway protein GspF [Shewanella]MCC4833626.1 general secretion pathway protein GspF [Shewanella sp. 10N.7]MCL1043814.1 general secretion pathway protein GspF [Shewanella electrodiphila]